MQEPSGRWGAGGTYLATTRAPGRRGTAGAERIVEEEEPGKNPASRHATRTLRAVVEEPTRTPWWWCVVIMGGAVFPFGL